MTPDATLSPIFDQVQRWMAGTDSRPPAERLVEALLAVEKARRGRISWTYADLNGSWRLSFITGTRVSRQRAGVVLGAGRYVPRWISIGLTYTPDIPDSVAVTEVKEPVGWVYNRVALAEAALTVSGPTRLWPRGILAFDFTRIAVELGPWSVVEVPIRDGRDRELVFYQQPLKQQAFFNYFLVEPNYIAARGRGGGLALWIRDSTSSAEGTEPPRIAE